MRRRLFAAIVLLALGATTRPARPQAKPAAAAPHPVSTNAQLLALEGDRLLVWDYGGRAELREADGTWSQELQLPLEAVAHVARDGAGFSIDGADPKVKSGRFVVRLDAHGKEQRRWTVPDKSGALTVGPGGRRVATCNGALTLRDDGTQGPAEHFPWDNPYGCCFLPALLPADGATIVCRVADVTKQCNAPGSCERPGAGGWRFEAGFAWQAPLACGAWLVTHEGPQVVVRSSATGKIAAKTSLTGPSALACAGSDQLLIGGKRLSLLSLPGLRRGRSLPIAGGSVSDLVVGDSFIAYKSFASGHPAVNVLPLGAAR